MQKKEKLQFYIPDQSAGTLIPFIESRISAGFPSVAEDYVDRVLDLNELLIKHPAATFFVRVQGHSMINGGIHPNDILVVDRALTPSDGRIVIARLNGEMTVKRFKIDGGRILLIADNPIYLPIEITPESDFEVWGVVTSIIHQV